MKKNNMYCTCTKWQDNARYNYINMHHTCRFNFILIKKNRLVLSGHQLRSNHSYYYPVRACTARGRVIVLSVGRSDCLFVCLHQVRTLSKTGLFVGPTCYII